MGDQLAVLGRGIHAREQRHERRPQGRLAGLESAREGDEQRLVGVLLHEPREHAQARPMRLGVGRFSREDLEQLEQFLRGGRLGRGQECLDFLRPVPGRCLELAEKVFAGEHQFELSIGPSSVLKTPGRRAAHTSALPAHRSHPSITARRDIALGP